MEFHLDIIKPAAAAEDVRAARQLFEEYAAELGVDLRFQGFAHELETLPGAYTPPRGALLLARAAEGAAGCVAMRPKGDDVCEMKRLFVRPAFRGQGLALALVAEIIAAAETAGYRAMVLDTLDGMKPAIALYKSFGFQRSAAYYDNPLPGAVYFRRTLAPPPTGLRCGEFAFGSGTYRESVRLREEVLRRPLGLSWEPDAFDGEDTSFHLGCFAGDELAGTLVLRPLNAATLKMRQVAVSPAWQSRGAGTMLVRFAEHFAAARGYSSIVAHARATALGFYHKHGYRADGDNFLEVSIPHVGIQKTLLRPT
ncbi:MAG: GNAT family N-acetyltransferase [Verrucomicrobia bacterium]|nr:GNAT family N-acetyltransferase [Verrucomicrobiota bacterium]